MLKNSKILAITYDMWEGMTFSDFQTATTRIPLQYCQESTIVKDNLQGGTKWEKKCQTHAK